MTSGRHYSSAISSYIDHDGVCTVDDSPISVVSPNHYVQYNFVEEHAQNLKEEASQNMK
jgi:hypothetical protein